MYVLQQKVQEHCGEGIPDKACLLELGWYTKEVIVTYMECEKCEEKGCHVNDNREQGVIRDRQRWYRCQKRKEEEVARPKEANTQ